MIKKKLVFSLLLSASYMVAQLNVLHLSFHSGCVNDIEYVAQQLNLNLTSWHIPSSERVRFDGIEQLGNDIMNIGPMHAKRIWDLNKEYFNQFDLIITSDTAPLIRIFLQNGWQKPLIIWICNRFDYHDDGNNYEHFPDPDYYQIFADAAHRENVVIVGYTRFEHFYANERGVATGNLIIKPCGIQNSIAVECITQISTDIDKPNTFFIPPREGSGYLKGQCIKLGIPAYTGPYNGPQDLKYFKGIIHWPYQWSNFALFENIGQGLVYFVPSAQLVRLWFYNGHEEGLWYPMSSLDIQLLELAEWWCPEHKNIIVYFDSWDDLKHKIQTTDFVAMRKRVKMFGAKHVQEMIERWRLCFKKFFHTI